MKKRIKIIAAALSIIVMGECFCGCGKKKESTGSSAPASDEGQATSVSLDTGRDLKIHTLKNHMSDAERASVTEGPLQLLDKPWEKGTTAGEYGDGVYVELWTREDFLRDMEEHPEDYSYMTPEELEEYKANCVSSIRGFTVDGRNYGCMIIPGCVDVYGFYYTYKDGQFEPSEIRDMEDLKRILPDLMKEYQKEEYQYTYISDAFDPEQMEKDGIRVFEAVDNKSFDFGVVPIANSTAGSVTATYELLKKYDLKICAGTKLRISHCLAARKDTDPNDIQIVYSHEQALMQCSDYITRHGYKGHNYANTALAAQFIAQSDRPVAAICSHESALNNGLKIIADDIANAAENYTRFIVISKKTLCTEKADVISVSLSLPHEKSALYRLLTKFSVAGLNLTMIESRPIANTDFDAVFYLDFEGSIRDAQVAMLINELKQELTYFKFLGNYEEITGGAEK